jgi:hypothetical protein
MSPRKSVPVGTILMILVIALATVGVAYGLWTKTLFISGSVTAGNVNSDFARVFTDDDEVVDDATLDDGDAGPDPSSAGPLATRSAQDIALCTARVGMADEDRDLEQPGIQTAFLTIEQGYPSYWCTAWFDLNNTGSIPVNLHSVSVPVPGGDPIAISRCEVGLTQLDLNGDTVADIEVCASNLPAEGEARIDPGVPFRLDLATHILQVDANQGQAFQFLIELFLHQWNEEPGEEPTPVPTEVPTEVPPTATPVA